MRRETVELERTHIEAITSALRLAGRQYRENVTTMTEAVEASPGFLPLVKQFERQAGQVETLCDMLEYATALTLVPDEDDDEGIAELKQLAIAYRRI